MDNQELAIVLSIVQPYVSDILIELSHSLYEPGLFSLSTPFVYVYLFHNFGNKITGSVEILYPCRVINSKEIKSVCHDHSYSCKWSCFFIKEEDELQSSDYVNILKLFKKK